MFNALRRDVDTLRATNEQAYEYWLSDSTEIASELLKRVAADARVLANQAAQVAGQLRQKT